MGHPLISYRALANVFPLACSLSNHCWSSLLNLFSFSIVFTFLHQLILSLPLLFHQLFDFTFVYWHLYDISSTVSKMEESNFLLIDTSPESPEMDRDEKPPLHQAQFESLSHKLRAHYIRRFGNFQRAEKPTPLPPEFAGRYCGTL